MTSLRIGVLAFWRALVVRLEHVLLGIVQDWRGIGLQDTKLWLEMPLRSARVRGNAGAALARGVSGDAVIPLHSERKTLVTGRLVGDI